MNNVLLIEDDTNLGLLLKENFDNKGLRVHWCKDGEEGVNAFYANQFDICILDVMLPKKDGFSISKELRKIDRGIPFIFLTARSLSEDKYKGFDLGCDDYVTKPFNAQELYLRIKAILKRAQVSSGQAQVEQELLRIGKFTFDYEKRLLIIDENIRKLSSKEAELLHLMATSKNRLINRRQILLSVWGNDDYFASKSLDVYMTKLRKLMKDDPCIEFLNAYGSGYKLIEK